MQCNNPRHSSSHISLHIRRYAYHCRYHTIPYYTYAIVTGELYDGVRIIADTDTTVDSYAIVTLRSIV